MAKSVQIASVFTALGFKVNKKDLDKLQKQLSNLKKQIKSLQRGSSINIAVNHKSLDTARKQLSAINRELTKVHSKTVNVKVNRTGNGHTNGTSMGASKSVFKGAAAGSAAGSQLGQFGPGVGAAGLAAFGGASIFQTTAKLDAIKNALGASAGGAAEGAKQFEWLEGVTDRIGINFLDNARSYQNFLAASNAVGFSTNNAQDAFTATASAARVLGLSAADTNGAMRAMTQILSKGTVQAEELRGQLGERVPGAVGMMAKAVAEMQGKTEVTVAELGKMLEQGEIISKDVMPFFSKQLLKMASAHGALERAQKSPLANLERMKNSFVKLQNRIGKADFVGELSDLFMTLTGSMDGTGEGATAFGETLAIIVDAFTALVNIVAQVPGWFIVIAALFFPFTRWLAILSGIVLVIEDIMVGFNGGDSVIKSMVSNLGTMEKVALGVAGIFSLWLARSILIRNAAIATAAAHKLSAGSAALGAGKSIAGKAGLVGLAALAGTAVGTVIYSNLEDESRVNVGRNVAKTLAFFGNDNAQQMLDSEAALESMSSPKGRSQVAVTVKVEADEGLTASQADTATDQE